MNSQLSRDKRQSAAIPGMILVCPTCRTRYKVDEGAVSRPTGRTVRCASCGHVWHHLTPLPPSARQRERPPAVIQEAASTPIAAVPRAAIIAPSPPRQRRRSGLLLVLLILLVGAAIVAAILERDVIVAMWPAAARLYELVGLKT
jgi:predicted Zn finger-like uncharacterized protein